MRWPRFTLLQLFLFTALVGLLAGWGTQAWQSGTQAQLASVEISPDGKFLAAIYFSRGPQVWDISGRQPRRIATPNLANDQASGYPFMPLLRFQSDGSLIFHRNSQRGSELVRYDLASHKEQTLLRAPSAFASWAVSLDGQTAITFDGTATPAGSTLDVWDLKSGKIVRKLNAPATQYLFRFEVDAQGTVVAAFGNSTMQIDVLDVKAGSSRTIVGSSFGEPWALAADGKTLVVADWMKPGGQIADHCDVFVHDLRDPSAKPIEFDSDEFVTNAEISHDGSRVLLSSFRSGEVWDTRSARQLWKRDDAAMAVSIFGPFQMMDGWKLSADGSRVATTAPGRAIQVLDAATGQTLMTIGGTHRLRDFLLYTVAFIGWAVGWGLVSRREKLRQPAAPPMPALPVLRLRLMSQWQGYVILLAFVAVLCGLLAWSLMGLFGDWLNVRPGFPLFLAIFAVSFGIAIGYYYLKLRIWPLWGSLRFAQAIVGNTGRRKRHGKITGFFAGESTIEHSYLGHIEEIRQKLAELLGREIEMERELLVIGLARSEDYYLLNRTRLPHGGIVMTHLFADECRVCEELAHRDAATATVMLRASIALALLRRHWRVDAPVWLSAVITSYLAADEHQPAMLKRAHRMLTGILGDEAPACGQRLVSMPLTDRYTQIFQKDDPAILRELTLGQAVATSLGEYFLGIHASSQREKMLAVLRSVGRSGNVEEAFQRAFGHGASELIEPWWQWAQAQPLSSWEPPPAEARWAIGELARSILPGSSLSLVEQQRNVTMLGAAGDLAVVPSLLTILEISSHPLRAEALWALRGISGQRWDDDPPRWRTWWQEVEPQAAAASTSFKPPIAAQWSSGPWADVVKAELAIVTRAAEHPSADAPHEPWRLVAARTCMGAGGIWGIVFTVAISFYSTTLILLPMLAIALLVGLLATARAAGRHWWGLRTAAGLQSATLFGCDVVQAALGVSAAMLLRDNDVKRYLQRIGGS